MLALLITLKTLAAQHAVEIAAVGAYALLEWALPRVKFIQANSGLELLANLAKKALIDRVPLVGRLVTLLATKQPAALPLPPDSSLRALLPLAFIALALNGCATTNRIIADEVTKCGPGLLSAYAQSKSVLETATSKEAALGELMAIAQAVGADVSSVYCVVSVIVNDLKAARSQDGGAAPAASQLRPLVAGGDAMYPSDPVAHGIALGQEILSSKK